jgi:hypothetical protein
MQEIPMRSSLLFVLAFPFLAGCQNSHDHDKDASSSFNNRLRCAQFAQSGKWENEAEGPFLDETYYSPSLDTCVFVMRQSFPAEANGEIQNIVEVVDGLSRKQLWGNDPKAGQTEDQINAALDQELTKLQVIR